MERYILVQVVSYQDGVMWTKLYKTTNKDIYNHIKAIAEIDIENEYLRGYGLSNSEFIFYKDITPETI